MSNTAFRKPLPGTDLDCINNGNISITPVGSNRTDNNYLKTIV